MPSDDYASAVSGGALKLKGAKVHKSKKKKKDKASDLERSLSTGDSKSTPNEHKVEKHSKAAEDTVAADNEDEEGGPVEYKTAAEKRHEEYKRKQMMKMAETSSSRPELLKTHKERVEELNTYLSKLSEHHDMPKIGPG